MKKQFSHLLCAAALLLSGPLAIAQSADLLQKAQAGDAQAQFKLAAVYLTGRGGPKNDDEAAKWFMLAAQQGGIPLYEYTPMQIKLAVTGNGHADKKQVQQMVKLLLNLKTVPKPDDAADALGAAICHANTSEVSRAEFRIK